MSARRPTPTGTPASPPSPAATWPRRRAASSWSPTLLPDQVSSWTLAAGAFWAARTNLLAGNPQKFAPYLKRAALHGRTFHGLVAQKMLGMQIAPDWNVPALDRKRADVLRNDRAGRRALALFQLGASTAAERELFAASLDADPQYIETVLAVAAEGGAARPVGPGRQRRLGPARQDHGLRRRDVSAAAVAAG